MAEHQMFLLFRWGEKFQTDFSIYYLGPTIICIIFRLIVLLHIAGTVNSNCRSKGHQDSLQLGSPGRALPQQNLSEKYHGECFSNFFLACPCCSSPRLTFGQINDFVFCVLSDTWSNWNDIDSENVIGPNTIMTRPTFGLSGVLRIKWKMIFKIWRRWSNFLSTQDFFDNPTQPNILVIWQSIYNWFD